MPRGSEDLTNTRKEEIINACAGLYETTGFREITIRDIAAKTSFTRTSVYNYFQTKEEIFLALVQREYELWTADIEFIERGNDTLTAEGFARALAATLEKRKTMLKLMSMNIYDMECNSRLDNLVAFKVSYADAIGAVRRCLEKFFPRMAAEEVQAFLYALFPFLFGVYPYTSHTEKQLKAIELAHAEYTEYSIYELVRQFVYRLLLPFQDEAASVG